MALFNPFRESAPATQRLARESVPRTNAMPINRQSINGNNGFNEFNGIRDPLGRPCRGGGASGRFQRGRPPRGTGFRGRGSGRGGRNPGPYQHDRRYQPGQNFTPDEMSVDFQCEACERVFVNETDLNDHVKLHVACAHCNYSALQQLVDLHIKLVHDKHLASKVMEQSPEEIAEYLAERRRKFPRRKIDQPDSETETDQRLSNSQENVVPQTAGNLKKGVIHEENVRGNRTGKFGHITEKSQRSQDCLSEVQQPEHATQRSRQRKRRRPRSSRAKQENPIAPVQDEGPQILEGVPRFRGFRVAEKSSTNASLKFNEDGDANNCTDQDNISDIDDFTPAQPTQLPLTAAKALASLMACYSDSDEEDGREKADDRNSNNNNNLQTPPAKQPRLQDVHKQETKMIEDVTSSINQNTTNEDNSSTSHSQCNNATKLATRHPTCSTSPVNTSMKITEHQSNISTNEVINSERDLQTPHNTRSESESSSVPVLNIDPAVKTAVRALVDNVVLTERAVTSRRAPRRPQPPAMSQRKLSLLEKLLAKDIRHERNILLQCVDFVVQNNFFDGMDYDV